MPTQAATQTARLQPAKPLFKIFGARLRARGGDPIGQIAWVAVSAFLLAMIYGLASPQVALAAGVDLAVICPSGGSSEPSLQDPQTGSTVPITDQKLRAVAAKACGSPGPSVQIANGRTNAIFVAFTNSDHQLGPITWGSGCTQVAGGAVIGAGMTCSATISSSAGSTRFCAVNVFPAVLNGTLAAKNGVTMDCFNAQANNQTMVETTFQPNGPSCFNVGNCVWYDISIIPSTCTDALWKQNDCANTGGASYNLPVSIACGGTTYYSCKGPTSGTYGNSNYPSNCGNPNSRCLSGPSCQNAYFYPMFSPPENQYQPNRACLGGQILTITFPSGP